MLTVVLPHSTEVRLLGKGKLVLVGVNHILLGDELRSDLTHSVPLLLEFFSTLSCCGVDAEDEILLLVSMYEGVKIFFRVIKMATVSEPGGIWNLIVEQAR